jgi:hypothetical protein
MKLSLRQSFQLSRSLGGYMVGTTVGFRVMTMEALAPWLTIESHSGTHSDIRVPDVPPESR